MTAHNWIAVRNMVNDFPPAPHGISGLCSESGEPIEIWCENCLLREAVHELATQQTLAAAKAFGAIKEKP